LNKVIIVVLLMAIFYVVFVAYSDFSKFSSNIEHFKFEFLPIILGLAFTGLFINGIRQKILLDKIEVKISLKENVLLYLAGLSMIVTPGGAGQLIKSYYLKKKFNYKIAKTFPLVFVERYQDLITLVCIILVALIFVQISEITIVVSILAGIAILAYISVRIRKLFEGLLNILTKFQRLTKLVKSLSESYEGLYLMTSPVTIIKNWALGIVSWSLEAVAIYLVFVAFDVDIGFILSILIIYSSILFGAISFIPGGVGVTEVSALGLLANEGVEISLATSLIIMIRAMTIWFATAIGFITTKFFMSK